MPAYQVTGPDGRRYRVDTPEWATSEDAIAYIYSTQYAGKTAAQPTAPTPAPTSAPKPEEQSVLRQVADVPLQAGAGLGVGIRMITDAFGADNPVSQGIRGVENYLQDLLSAQSKEDQKEISRIMQEAQDKGIGDQVVAGLKAFATAPVDILSQAAGTALPTIVGGLAGAALKAPAMLGAIGTGAVMGTGMIKSDIYDEVKSTLTEMGASPQEAERRAVLAQEYGGQNLDQILLGTVIGGVTGRFGIEASAAKEIAKGIARKTALRAAAEEAVPEAVQAAQEQVAQNVALQREGIDVPTFRGAASAATLEGIAGAVLGGGYEKIGTYQERAAAKQAEEDRRVQAEEDRRVADVAETYRRGAEQVPLGERPEDIPTRRPPPVAPETEDVTPPAPPVTDVTAPPAVPEGTTSIEDLLGFTDEEGPPEYTDADVPAFVRGEERVAPVKEKLADKFELIDVGADPRIQSVKKEEDEIKTLRRAAYDERDAAADANDEAALSDAFDKIDTLNKQLAEVEQRRIQVSQKVRAEKAAPKAEVPSGLAEPAVDEAVRGAGVRGAELPVSRPGAEGQGIEEPAGAGVGLPPSDITGAPERAAAAEPALETQPVKPDPISKRIIESGAGSDFVRNLYSADPQDAIATDFNIEVTKEDINKSRDYIKNVSQNMLRNEFGDEVTLYRGIKGTEEKSPVISYTLDKDIARFNAEQQGLRIGEIEEIKVPVSEILSYSEAIGKGTFQEREVLISKNARQAARTAEVDVPAAPQATAALAAQGELQLEIPETIEQRQEQQKQTLTQAEEEAVHGKLNDTQKRVIAKEFGQDSYNDVAKKNFIEEVIKGINEGIQSVRARLRGIVRAVMVAVLSTNMVFNPVAFKNLNAQPMLVVAESTIQPTDIAKPAPPAEAARAMSGAARATYERMMLDNKDVPFIIADKPSAQVFLFKADGSLIQFFPALFGKTKGDVLGHPIGAQLTAQEINKTLDSERITPAGVFDAVLIRGKDYPLQLSFKDAQGNIGVIALHQVYTGNIKEQRLKRLSSADITDNRVSFGCINVGLDNFNNYVVPNYGKGARIGVVPDETGALDKYIPAPQMSVRYTVDETGKSSTKILSAEPVSTPETPGLPPESRRRESRAATVRRRKETTPSEPESDITLFSITPQNVADVWANPAFAPHAPAFRPRVKQVIGQARDGVISAEQAVNQIEALASTTETRERAPVVRDVAHFKARLTQALRQGRINQATHDLTQWLISKNPNLIEGLGLSISTRDPSGRRLPLGVQGLYSVVQDIVTLVPRANSDVTLVHEILHRAERMMPRDIQAQIRKIWERQLFANLRTAEMRGDVFQKDFYNRLVEYHFGDANTPDDLKALQDLIKTGAVPAESYQFMNPSEFWAVNASRIMENRFKASPNFIARLKQWMKEFVERIKGVMDLPSDAPFLRAMGRVMKGKGEFISPTIYGDERLNNIDRPTRYKGWKSPARQYRDGEELITNRAKRNQEVKKPPNPNELIKQSLTKEAYEKFVENAASILRPWKRLQQRLDNEGSLIVSGPDANDAYGTLSQVTGIARWYANMYIVPLEHKIYNGISVYGQEKGISPEYAIEFVSQMRQAVMADLRRDEFFRRYRPLKIDAVITLRNGRKASPAALRRQLYNRAAELLGDQKIPREQKLKMLDDIRAHLDAIVSNEAYADPFGDSMHPNRPVDADGNNLAMSTNWDSPFYSPAEGTDPILQTGPTKQVLEQDLQKYPALRVVMNDINKLIEVTKELKRIGGLWNEYMDDVSHFYGWGDGYSPLMMEKEDNPLNLEGARALGDVATFMPGMKGGKHIVTNAVYQLLSNAYRASTIAARAPVTHRIANLIDTGKIPGKHEIDITPREQFMMALNHSPIPTEIMGGNIIVDTMPDGTKRVYRMDDTTPEGKKLLDGVRRVNEELPPILHMLSKVQGVIANQFTRLRVPFAPAQFIMDSMTLAPLISAEYGYRFGPEFLARAMSNLATLKGPKLYKLLQLYREGNEAGLREHIKDDPFLKDVLDYIREGGPSAYAEAYKIEKGLQKYVDKIRKHPLISAKEGFDELVDNWTDSWDLLSRVSAMGVFKRRELERLGYDVIAKIGGPNSPEARRIMDIAVKRAVNQAKELSNFNLHGNLFSRGISSIYMFWRPNLTTAVATADMLSKGFEDPKARIGRELSPEAQKKPELVDRKLKEFSEQQKRVRMIVMILMGAGMALYEFARLMSDYDEKGRNKVAISDKGQWLRAAQFRIPGTDWNFNAMFGFGPGGFMALGAQISALLHGDQTVKEFSKHSMDTVLSMFTPITPSQISMTENFFGWLFTTFSPALLKPGLEYLGNRTSVDTSIYNAYPSRFSEVYSGGKNVPDIYKDLSGLIWKYTGREINPNILYFYMTHYAQAFNDVVAGGYDIVNSMLGNKDIRDINWKFLFGSFISRTGNVDQREYFELQPLIKEARKRVSDLEVRGPSARENLQPHDEEIVRTAKFADARIQALNEARNKLNRPNKLSPEEKKKQLERVEAQLNEIMRAVTAEIKRVQLTKQASKP